MNDENRSVNLEDFAQMAGFPVELIKKELFADNNELKESEEVNLEELRAAMVSYLNSTMLES
ncbi:MAG: hypothetical protein QF441_06820 [Bacteriovoracaceae bacterium]|jgi:hypothetical protein|nr:hypothetical protein [Halobacteriovoraceae bacterium]MAX67673.1 hypothetical protein [Halobacteriovoraceae bacterium]MDP7320304.1 hypothetical protein [Bacteriovoracaceae bacterium]|tara:strand:+ start:508 stop:693 length:186 start_codon:yes stop_codon:yes gene_type:complete